MQSRQSLPQKRNGRVTDAGRLLLGNGARGPGRARQTPRPSRPGGEMPEEPSPGVLGMDGEVPNG